MKKAKFGSVPPKTQKLADGRYRVYLNVEKSTETNTIKRNLSLRYWQTDIMHTLLVKGTTCDFCQSKGF